MLRFVVAYRCVPDLLFFSPETIRRHSDDAYVVNRGPDPRALSPFSEASRNHEGEKTSPRGYAPALQKAVHHRRGRRRASLFALI